MFYSPTLTTAAAVITSLTALAACTLATQLPPVPAAVVVLTMFTLILLLVCRVCQRSYMTNWQAKKQNWLMLRFFGTIGNLTKF